MRVHQSSKVRLRQLVSAEAAAVPIDSPLFCWQVHLESGDKIDIISMHSLIQNLSIGKEFSDTPEFLNVALLDLMARYGTFKEGFFENNTENSVQHHKPEHEKHGHSQLDCADSPRHLAMAAHIGGADSVVVHLRLERARGIGWVDLWGGADLFCVAFVGDWRTGRRPHGNVKGNRLFQTNVMRGRTEADWTWNEVHALLSLLLFWRIIKANQSLIFCHSMSLPHLNHLLFLQPLDKICFSLP